ncbi:carboxylating nicotinate-nucleotide diphosphorylase [Aureimonas mangrovi]|uniref:carboxylating nicotinate-nucleotide diphosphorylase n=1 Tax=Aureimonas mangrovi TaxID=2758041 RepID=UPI00163DB478|nr:carboxylating nicotinate-nucleotide diphosphorylase [Aureimonas mangrovi]
MTLAHLPELPAPLVADLVRAALLEDLGRAGDITSMATIAPGRIARATLAARREGVLAGLPLAGEAFRQMDGDLRFTAHLGDGARLVPGDVVAEIEGDARALLSAERTALNFLMHLSGVASLTARFVVAVEGTGAKIVCTRKTLPGLRWAEKYAVRCGGGANHRFGLDDAVLIKDNHIAVAGGVTPALRAAQAYAGHLVAIEIEVDTLEQLSEAIEAGADAVLLDNMDAATLARAVKMTAGRARLEASGNVDLDTVAEIAASGVDLISTSKITMSAPALDLGLDIEIA